MKSAHSKLYALRIVVITVAAVVGLIHLFNTWSRGAQGGGRPVTHHYQITVLSQDEARPGRVFTARSEGQELATYTCKGDEAAVALVSVADSSKDAEVRFMVGPAIGVNLRKYATSFHQVGNLCFISLLRGFGKKPKELEITVYVLPKHAIAGSEYETKTFTLSKIAEPVRLFSPPNHTDAVKAEKLATAVYQGIERGILIRLANGVQATPTIISTSFSTLESVTKETLISNRNIAGYCDKYTDAVKVRLDPYSVVTKRLSVVYHNAEIVTTHGVSLLSLPTTQLVGEVDGQPIVIDQHLVDVQSNEKTSHSYGSIKVRLLPPTAESKRVKTHELMVCTSIDPLPATMGLATVEVGMPAETTTRFAGRPRATHDGKTVIPTLRLFLDCTRNNPAPSQIIILPVHIPDNLFSMPAQTAPP